MSKDQKDKAQPLTGGAPAALPDLKSDHTAFALLGSAPYIWTRGDSKNISWLDESVALGLYRASAEVLPKSESELIGRICDQGASQRAQALAALTWNGAKCQCEYQIRTFDGRNIWVEERMQRLSGDKSGPARLLGILTDVQTRKLQEQQAGYHASYDSLTGLWNSERLREGLTQLLAYAHRYDRQSAYIGIRVSNLEDINLTYGYEAGDRLLTAIAKRMTAQVRSPDICGRVGGVSFGVGLTDCGGDQMKSIAERLVKALSDSPYGSPYGDLYAEFSMGGIALSQKSVSAVDAMEQAQTAIAHSQLQQGIFVPFSTGLSDLKPRRMSDNLSRDDIIHALNDRRITLAYQPIVHAQTRAPHHYECLLRLRRDDGELISAADFIMAAERIECVHLLDRRALEIAGEALRNYPEVKLALNVSAATVKNPETADAYLTALKALGQATERVTLELTETVALEDPAMASRFSVEARSLGCAFAIDDFGAGYTTFRNLMAIEADEIKIDGSFIRDLSLTPHKQVFVRMMVDLAQTFSVKTVAEMVGSREDADLLTRLGVDLLQGYMFGVPGPAPFTGAAPKAGALKP